MIILVLRLYGQQAIKTKPLTLEQAAQRIKGWKANYHFSPTVQHEDVDAPEVNPNPVHEIERIMV